MGMVQACFPCGKSRRYREIKPEHLNRGYGKHASTGSLERPGTETASKRNMFDKIVSTDGQPARRSIPL
jgi:hypothetical protein